MKNIKVGQIGKGIFGKKILSNTIIGAASLVTKNCKSYSIYYGVPAKKIAKRSFNKNYL